MIPLVSLLYIYQSQKPYIRLVSSQQSNKYNLQGELENLIDNKQESLYLISQDLANCKPLLLHSRAKSKKCHLLDQYLRIITTDYKIRNLQKQYNLELQKFQIRTNNNNRDQQQYPKNYVSKFIKFQYQQFSINHELLFGRAHWGKKHNYIVISDDEISRKHCKIQHLEESQSLFEIQVRKCIKKCRKSSFLKQLPQQIIQKIFTYLKSSIKYQIIDCGSRNGTYIYTFPSFINNQWVHQPIQVTQGYGYQFDRHSSLITVLKIYSSNWNQQLDVHKHNQFIKKQINQFKSKVLRIGYFYLAPKYVYVPDQIYQKCKLQLGYDCICRKVSIILFEIKMNDKKQYYLLGTYERSNKQTIFQIGSGMVYLNNQQTNLDNNQMQQNRGEQIFNDGINKFNINMFQTFFDLDETPSVHGLLGYINNKWYISSNMKQLQIISMISSESKIIQVKGNQINFQQIYSHEDLFVKRIWVKITSKQKNFNSYPLSIQKKYKIRLANSYYYTLQFINFSKNIHE